MTGFDFAPLFRTAIGFDRLAQLMDTAASAAIHRTTSRRLAKTSIA
jgi:hypothetical protein